MPDEPAPASAQPKLEASSKPTKALPTDRAGLDKQLSILRAYGAIAADQGTTSVAIGEVVSVHNATVSVCNPFFAEAGLIERASPGGYRANAAVVAYHRAYQWNAATAAHKLAPVLRETWFWKALHPRLMFRPIDEAEAVNVLGEACNASPAARAQIRLVLDYLDAAGLIVRDGTTIKLRAPGIADVGDASEVAPPTTTGEPPKAAALVPPPKVTMPTVVQPGISLDVSISVSMDEMSGWSPLRIEKFFAGIAAVLAAKNLEPPPGEIRG